MTMRIDGNQIIDGVTVYGDDERDNVFYLLPETPRFRIDENGLPIFKFIKYRLPIDRPDGKRGGGFCIFDAEFVVSEDAKTAVVEVLQQQVNQAYSQRRQEPPKVEVGTLTYTEGTAVLNLEGVGGTLVERVINPGSPSLYGNLVTPFTVEFTPEGAAVFEDAMKGSGGVVQVTYNLTCWAKLPPVEVRGRFFASQFYSFFQEIDTDWNLWSEDSYQETIRESVRESESYNIEYNFDSLEDEKVKQEIRTWAQRTMEDAIGRKMIAAATPVAAKDREKPKGIEDVVRNISSNKISSFSLNYTESQAIKWTPDPRGTLPNISSIKDKDGNPLNLDDFFIEVDANDPFFETINVSTRVNADFENLPIDSVEVHIDYPKEDGKRQIWEKSFVSPDEVEKFEAYIANDSSSYKYWYQVNYKGESQVFKSEEIETDEQILTINVDDLGLLNLDIYAGDLNFEQVKQAQVTLQYEDKDNDVDLIEHQFTLDSENRQKRLQELIFHPMQQPYRYQVKYFMSNGKEFQVDWKEGRSQQHYINDPFNAMKTVGIRAAGDLDDEIATIFLDLKYVDSTNDYSQTKSVALSKDQPFFDWSFPAIDENLGTTIYAGSIQYKDGTSEPIDEVETTESTILVGKLVQDNLEITIVPDLIDFSEVRLAKLSLRYRDEANDITERKDFILKEGASIETWTVELKDKTKIEYEWQVIYFMADSSRKQTEPVTTSDPSIVLEVPVS